MADVDYSIAPWLTAQGNMGAQYAEIAQRSRAQRSTDQNRKFEQGIEQSDEDMRKQQFQAHVQAAAQQLADRKAYEADIAGGMDPKSAILKHPSVFSGRLPASVFTPQKPAPSSVPGTADPLAPFKMTPTPPAAIPPDWAMPGMKDQNTDAERAKASSEYRRLITPPNTSPQQREPIVKDVGGIKFTSVDGGTNWKPVAGSFRGSGGDAHPLTKDENYKSLLKQREAAWKAAMAPTSNGTTDVDKAQTYRMADDAIREYEQSHGLGAKKGDDKASEYKTPDDVKAAVKAGKMSKEDAVKTLQDQFGFQP